MDGATWGLVGGPSQGQSAAVSVPTSGHVLLTRPPSTRRSVGFYRRMFIWLVPLMLLFIVVVWAASLKVLPYWVYVIAMIAWFAPLGPTIVWANRRLAELAADQIQQHDGSFRGYFCRVMLRASLSGYDPFLPKLTRITCETAVDHANRFADALGHVQGSAASGREDALPPQVDEGSSQKSLMIEPSQMAYCYSRQNMADWLGANLLNPAPRWVCSRGDRSACWSSFVTWGLIWSSHNDPWYLRTRPQSSLVDDPENFRARGISAA